MRVLLTGATGLIGAAVLARLVREGHEVIAVARPGRARTELGATRWLALDIAKAGRAGDWLPHVVGIDAVVNCAGVLQDGPRDSTKAVHVEGAAALFAACEQAGVRRVIHISAVGVNCGAATAFGRSKLAGDQALMARNLDWVILRPSVVVGRAAYGGSALLRGLAALPVVPQMPDAGALQVVQIEDLVQTVVHFLSPGASEHVALDVVGPERLSVMDAVLAYRRWLGWRNARVVRLPRWLMHGLSGAGDLAGLLGWRSPMRTTARRELARGATGDGSEWRSITGIAPQSLADALAGEPASVQERWFARLYLLKPVVLGVLALDWIASGLLQLAWHMRFTTDARPDIAPLVAVVNIAIGIAIAVRRTARPALLAALGLTILQLVLGTVFAPEVWLDQRGLLLSEVPLLALTLVALATLDER
ncbi:MAG TPA: NAD-dependent epimerase/dehydratase family protein [Hyphomicrobiaceae bacterium]